MKPNDYQLLCDACENPEAFLKMAETYFDHPEQEAKLLRKYLETIKMSTRIKGASLSMQVTPYSNGVALPVVTITFMDDPNHYQLQGVLLDDDPSNSVHIMLSRVGQTSLRS